ncbi:hypothetical protein BJ165DRAFT_1534246 [Panaeolus papilionaceus]|nr:hypothetical protein BJ165DRAFT_1534246 [Panaeolus papilionaceus]
MHAKFQGKAFRIGTGKAVCPKERHYTACLVVAGHLSENPKWNVLVIEAGPTSQGLLDVQVPFFSVKLRSSKNPYDWNSTTIPQIGINNRTINFPRARFLGGGSAHSDPGWSWKQLLSYMLKTEKWTHQSGDNGKYDPKFHGNTGPVVMTLPTYPQIIDKMILQTTKELKHEFPFIVDINAGRPIGFGWRQSTIDHGVRSNSVTGFLEPALKGRIFYVLTNTIATRILPSHPGRSAFRTVEITQGGQTRTVSAKKEVVLSLGVIGTPKILLDSGIGDKDKLQSIGVQSRLQVHLPDVGRNLSGQPSMGHLSFANTTNLNWSSNTTFFNAAVAQWNSSHTGPLADGAPNHLGFVRIPRNSSVFHRVSDPSPCPNSPHIMLTPSSGNGFALSLPGGGNLVGMTTHIITYPPFTRFNDPNLTTLAGGYVRIKSTNPLNQPIIDLGVLTSKFDFLAMKEAIRSVQRFFSAPTWRGFILGPMNPALLPQRDRCNGRILYQELNEFTTSYPYCPSWPVEIYDLIIHFFATSSPDINDLARETHRRKPIQDLIQCAQVSSALSRICKRYIFKELKVDLFDGGMIQRAQRFTEITTSNADIARLVSKLHISMEMDGFKTFIEDQDIDVFTKALLRFTCLKILKILAFRAPTRMRDSDDMDVLNNAKDVMVANILSTYLNASQSTVESIELWHVSSLTSSDWDEILLCPTLHTLNFSGAPLPPAVTRPFFVASNPIKCLKAHCETFNLSTLLHFPALEILELSVGSSIEDDGKALLCTKNVAYPSFNLTQLYLDSDTGRPYFAMLSRFFNAFAHDAGRRPFDKLECICAMIVIEEDVKAVGELLKYVESLKWLQLECFRDTLFTQIHIPQHIVDTFPKLDSLSLTLPAYADSVPERDAIFSDILNFMRDLSSNNVIEYFELALEVSFDNEAAYRDIEDLWRAISITLASSEGFPMLQTFYPMMWVIKGDDYNNRSDGQDKAIKAIFERGLSEVRQRQDVIVNYNIDPR